MQRRTLEQQIRRVKEGKDPIGVIFDETQALVKVPSGNFFRQSEPAKEPA